jgi:hypothetical protein
MVHMAWRKAIVAAVFVVAGMSSAHAQNFGPNVGDVLPSISAMDRRARSGIWLHWAAKMALCCLSRALRTGVRIASNR